MLNRGVYHLLKKNFNTGVCCVLTQKDFQNLDLLNQRLAVLNAFPAIIQRLFDHFGQSIGCFLVSFAHEDENYCMETNQ